MQNENEWSNDQFNFYKFNPNTGMNILFWEAFVFLVLLFRCIFSTSLWNAWCNSSQEKLEKKLQDNRARVEDEYQRYDWPQTPYINKMNLYFSVFCLPVSFCCGRFKRILLSLKSMVMHLIIWNVLYFDAQHYMQGTWGSKISFWEGSNKNSCVAGKQIPFSHNHYSVSLNLI